MRLGFGRLNEDNFLQVLVDWAQSAYGSELARHGGEYPHMTDFETEEQMTKQILIWFVLEWTNPRTSTTLVEEFVDRFVKDPALAAKVGQFGRAFYGTFRIVQRVSDCTYVVTNPVTKKRYRVKLRTPIPSGAELTFNGYIHPWEADGTHRATGILTFREAQPTPFITPDMQDDLFRMMMKEKQDRYESVPVSAATRLSTYLKNQPIELVNAVSGFLNVPEGRKKEKISGIRTALSGGGAARVLKSLPEKELACLLYVRQSPQKAAKYGGLERRFGDDDFDPYGPGRARSTIGRLREKGLLVVGRKAMGSKRYKVAVAPADLGAALDELDSSSGPDPPSESAPGRSESATKRPRSWMARFRR